ncbi:hypothetical protein CVT25_009932 [Psilocybe cyanescens]|uniref:Uncharacterized protein n=1 Tax=Psilocybe cyanescens TaxID=93625 RepID=A0A409XCQ2_PSICY|nr:hypothetical protein CVT25_009932 [Psilocybe cyanescens]
MTSLDEQPPINPRPPDPGRNPPSQKGGVCSEDNAPVFMASIVTLASAGKTIALMESIFHTTRIIAGENENDGVDFRSLTQRLEDLQTLMHNGLSSMPVARVSSLHDLLENYRCVISTIQNHIHSGPMAMELVDEYARYVNDFRKEFRLQVSLIADNHRERVLTLHLRMLLVDMFRNCKNFIISGGNFVATVPDTHPQTCPNDKLVKLAYVQIGILFGAAGHV